MASKPEERFKFDWLCLVGQMRLGASMKNVAGWLSYHANRDGTSVRPGLDRLVRETELSKSMVQTCLKRFRDLGLIVRVSNGSTSAHRNWVDVYKLALPDGFEVGSAPPELPGSEGQPLVQRRGSKATHVRWHEQRDVIKEGCFYCKTAVAESSEGSAEGSAKGSGNPASEATTGNTQCETTGNTHPTTGAYRTPTKQCSTKHLETHHPSPSGAAERASSRGSSEPYQAFFARSWKEMVEPGEKLTEDDEHWVRSAIDLNYVTEQLGGLDEERSEHNLVAAMVERGESVKAVINTIKLQRGPAA